MRPLGLCSGFQVDQLVDFIQFFVLFLFFLEYIGTLASFQSVSHHYLVVGVQYQGYSKGGSM